MRCLVTSCTATVATGGWVSRGRGTRVVFHRESRGRRQRVLGELRMTVNYGGEKERAKLQALVYDIVPSTTAVFSYAIGSRKLSVNEQFFVGAQTVVSWLQTTQIKQGVSFIAANKVYTSTNKPQPFESRRNSLFYPGWMLSLIHI